MPAPTNLARPMVDGPSKKTTTQGNRQNYIEGANQKESQKELGSKPVEYSAHKVSGECTYSIYNKTKYDVVAKLMMVTKEGIEKETITVYLPPKKNHSIKGIPEGKYILKYCVGTGFDNDKKAVKQLIGCFKKLKAFEIQSHILKTIKDGDIVNRKTCEEGIEIGIATNEESKSDVNASRIPLADF